MASQSALTGVRFPRHTAVCAAFTCGILLLSGCTEVGSAARPSTPSSSRALVSPPPTKNAPTSVGEASESEVGRDWDQRPDTPIPSESALTDEQKVAFLRIGATDPAPRDACDPTKLVGQLIFLDAAAGSRLGELRLRNDGPACTLSGFPGIGFLGEWGHAFEVQVAQDPRIFGGDKDTVVTSIPLATGEQATLDVMWGSELAGAESEKAQTMYVQLYQDSVPLAVDLAAEPIAALDHHTTDIGMFTSVEVGPFLAAR